MASNSDLATDRGERDKVVPAIPDSILSERESNQPSSTLTSRPASDSVYFVVDTNEVNLSTAERAEIELMRTRWEELLNRRRRGRFRILDLPPELRLRIYRFLFESAYNPLYPRDLATFKLPPLTRANALIRAEALPTFFEISFVVTVKSNFSSRKEYRRRRRSHAVDPSSDWKSAGITLMRRQVRQLVEHAGRAAIFRDLTVDVTSSCKHHAARLRLRITNGNLSINTTRLAHYPSRNLFPYLPYDPQDVEAALNAARRQARDISCRPGFQGLMLSDIDTIAKKLRFVWPVRKSRT